MYSSDMEGHLESLERELDEVLRENTELRRVNDNLENQIHEDGGFIERIVELEEEFAIMRMLAIRNQAAVLRAESVAHEYLRHKEVISNEHVRELIQIMATDILKALVVESA